MTRNLLPCLALVCALVLTTTLSAQEETKAEAATPAVKQVDKKEQAKQKRIGQLVKKLAKEMRAAKLTEAQQTKLAELVESQLDALKKLQKQNGQLVNKQDRKTILEEIKKARADGKTPSEATKLAWDKVGVSAEDQTTLKGLHKQRDALYAKIKSDLAATFTEEQTKAMESAKANGGAKRKKGKRKGKGKEKKNAEDDAKK